jgi:hypothetical protein
MGEVTACQICGSTDLTVILDMGDQPLAERFDHPKTCPLALQQCGECTLVQLTWAVDQREVFPLDHPYTSGSTRALLEHFIGLAARVVRYLEPGDVICDIGANDGTFLGVVRHDVRKVAVEPTNQARKCAGNGIYTRQEFFTAATVTGIQAMHGPAKVITATNVLAHVPDPHGFCKGVADLLAHDGVFVTENHDVASILEGLQADTVYHEHQRYFSVTSLARLLGAHGLTITGVERIPTHGGSFRVFARRQRTDLAQRARVAAARLNRMLAGIVEDGGHVYGVGAATRATPLIHYAKIAPYITAVAEVPGSEKIGCHMPGTAIPVVDEALLVENQPEYALLFCWHVADSVVPALRKLGYKGRFLVPLPEPREIDG